MPLLFNRIQNILEFQVSESNNITRNTAAVLTQIIPQQPYFFFEELP